MKTIFILVVALVAGGYLYWYIDSESDAFTSQTPSNIETEAPEEAELDTFSGANSVEVYDGISIPSNSRTLNLADRGLTGSLKAEVRQLDNLQELDISNNSFTGVPAEVGQLSQLQILNLSGNPLTGLPHEIGNLQNLELLDLRDTDYSEQDLEIIKQKLSAEVTVLTN